MYVSEPPCGDSSLLYKSDSEQDFHWTGAKARDQVAQGQDSGITRLKSGRSDIASEMRSESMSCSDKIMIWNIVGLQGPLLGRILARPIYLSTIVVESGSSTTAMQAG